MEKIQKQWKPRNVRKDKKAFLEELNKVNTHKIPRHYAEMILIKNSHLTRTQIYSVRKGKSANWEILQLIAETANYSITRS